MNRLGNYTSVGIGILVLSTVLSWSGLGQALASQAQAAVQKVTITNKSVQVSGNVGISGPVAVSGSVNSTPAFPRSKPCRFLPFAKRSSMTLLYPHRHKD
jgi:hypothetical protein